MHDTHTIWWTSGLNARAPLGLPLLAMAQFPLPQSQLGSIEGVTCCPILVYVVSSQMDTHSV